MAFLSEELQNFSFKSWLQILGTGNKNYAPDNFAYYEEEYFNLLSVLPNQILAQYDQIPSASNITQAQANAVANPTLIADHTGVNAIHCTPSENGKLFLATSTYGDFDTRLTHWLLPQSIPQSNGNASIGYTIKFWNGDPNSGGVEIPTTTEIDGSIAGWYPMYGPGAILVASSFTSIVDITDVWITGFRYIGNIGLANLDAGFIKTFSCEATANVKDIVYADPLTDNKVLVNTNNTVDERSIGIVLEKLNSTTCRVLLEGDCNENYPSLTRGRIFLHTDGTPTNTVPTTGYLQELGQCFENGKLYFSPLNMRVKL